VGGWEREREREKRREGRKMKLIRVSISQHGRAFLPQNEKLCLYEEECGHFTICTSGGKPSAHRPHATRQSGRRGKFVPGRIEGEGAIQIFCSGCRRGIFWPLISHLVGCPKAQQTHHSQSHSQRSTKTHDRMWSAWPGEAGQIEKHVGISR
jgi:hypothetical protein